LDTDHPYRTIFESGLETGYVDDRHDFVAVGRELGMTGVVYTPSVDVLAGVCY
jgi:hypothetical protein